jgi:hypothetical protein
MQIMPTGGAWTNPAALTQQSLNDAKHPTANKNATAGLESVTPLEETGKTADRDANERYDGPSHGNSSKQEPDIAKIDTESMLSLPAYDDSEKAILDLMG